MLLPPHTHTLFPYTTLFRSFSVTPTRIQSGFNGQNEYEVREAWIVRSGKRSDLFFGRQFITDLGALRIDGLRVDRKSTRLNSSHLGISYAVFCLKKKKQLITRRGRQIAVQPVDDGTTAAWREQFRGRSLGRKSWTHHGPVEGDRENGLVAPGRHL